MNLRGQIDLQGFGTSEGVQKEWDTRGRGRKEKVHGVDKFLANYHTSTAPLSAHEQAKIKKEAAHSFWGDEGREKKIRVWKGVRQIVGTPKDLADDGWVDAPNRIVLQEMEVQKKAMGKGLGTQALNWLTGLADKHGVDLFLRARPFSEGGLDKAQLISWYKKHGFVQLDDGDINGGYMMRKPHSSG